MNFLLKYTFVILLCAILFACAQEKTKKIRIKYDPNSTIKTFNDWYLYKSSNACYIASYPISSSGNYIYRDANYIIISYNPITKKREISITGGLKYDNKANTTLEIDNDSYTFVNNDHHSWSLNEDEKIIKNLSKQPSGLVVFNYFENNIHAIDKYSTKGIVEALIEFKNECTINNYNFSKSNS